SDWHERWDTLSHGERKRAQIAVAIWLEPAILAVDEPTNHLDTEARKHLYHALKLFNGIGLIVSHDRELLDTLCHQCLFVEPPMVTLRSGNYTQGLVEKEKEDENLKSLYKVKKQAYMKLKKETAKRRNVASQSHRMRSKRGLDIKDHDSRFKKNCARITNKDGTGGKLLNQLDGRLKQAGEELRNVKVKKKYEMGIWVSGEKSGRTFLFNLKGNVIDFGGSGSLSFPDIHMYPDDRVALTGLNGAGKSTLISFIINSLQLDDNRLVYIPQEISRKSSKNVMFKAKRLSGSRLGKMMAVVSHLGSRPERLLESPEPSPGEIRKVMLATGIANEPHLIIMDEPTNHMDLPSIECLEKALDGCPCGLLLVSHDKMFLDRLTNQNWHISRKDKNQFVLNIL
ncbi:MAG: ATP-binding cassette domain-containing protein, partial [Desulfobacteraceae bacterium]